MVRNILQYKFFLVMIDQEGYYILHKSDIRRMVCMGLASFASTKTRLFHFVQIKVKLHIYFLRLFGSTGRSAVYAGCFHCGKNNPSYLRSHAIIFSHISSKERLRLAMIECSVLSIVHIHLAQGFCKILI